MKKNKSNPDKLFAALAVLMVIIIAVNAARVFSGNSVNYSTVIAEYNTVKVTSSAEMYVIRSESPITDSSGGYVIPVVPEGAKVGTDGEIARIFRNVDYAKYIDESTNIQSELDYYKSLKTNADSYVSNVPVYDRNILSSAIEYASAIDAGNCGTAADASDSVREYLTVKQIVMGEKINVDEKIADLENQLATITASALGGSYIPVTAEKGGYYFSKSDGLETSADYSAVTEITCSEIERLMSLSPVSGASAGMGKVVLSYVWYAVCVLPSERAGSLDVGSQYDIIFSDSSSGTVTMKLEAINPAPGGSEVAVVFSSKNMNEEIAALRKANVTICFEQYSGLFVPKSALRTVEFERQVEMKDSEGNTLLDSEGNVIYNTVTETKTGVYVLLNNISKFRNVDKVYENDEIFVSRLMETGDTGGYLKLNDEILTEGVGFEDEHIIRGRFSLLGN